MSRLLDAFPDIRARYDEPHRRYHDWAHVEAVWRGLSEAELDDRDACELATLFHDAVYDARRADNERESAALARATLRDTAHARKLPFVEALILATEKHTVPSDAPPHLADDCRAFLDADLAILAADEAAFDRYDAAIRAEYAHVPDALYRAGRAVVLARFLQRERLFLTEAMRPMEAPARANWRAPSRGWARRDVAASSLRP